MAAPAFLDGISARPFIVLAVANAILLPLWIGFAYGTYVEIVDNKLRVSRMLFRGKYTSLSDVVSIHVRPVYAGFIGEVYMKVRKSDGTFREQGLINMPGMKDNDMKKLVEMIRSANPNIQVDEDVLGSR